MATRKKASPDPAATPLVPPLALPNELTIYTVGKIHAHWCEWLRLAVASESAAAVQADAVDEIDGAGLQLLLSMSNALEGRSGGLQLRAPSDALRAGCAALGLADWLQDHTAQGAAA